MNKTLIALTLTAASLLAANAQADSATWTQKIITPETALKATQAATAECVRRGWQVAVAVTDPSGLPLVLLRDRYAGWHTVEAAEGKARTAASWRQPTSVVAKQVNQPDSPEQAIKNQPGAVMIGGVYRSMRPDRWSAPSGYRARQAAPTTISAPRPGWMPSRAIWRFDRD